MSHTWPGNVRQLEHAIEQAVLLADGDEIEAADLGIDVETPSGIRVDLPEDATDYHDVMADVTLYAERILIMRALEECQGNRTRAARFLGLSRRALLYKLERLHLT